MKKIISLVLLFIMILMLASCFHTTRNYKSYKKSYTLSELKMITDNSFKKLNEITYPTLNPAIMKLDQSYINAMKNFSFDLYEQIDKRGNLSFSPSGIYTILSILSLAAKDDTINEIFDSNLYLDKASRNQNYPLFYQNNYLKKADGTVQMYNGAFIDYKLDASEEFLNELVNYYCEAYSLNFNKDSDVAKMLEWIDERLLEQSFLTKEQLGINEFTTMYVFNTLLFENNWKTSFTDTYSRNDYFYLADKTEIVTKFMHHSYFGDAYDYGDYLSVYDYYTNKYKVQYLIPKDNETNIFELVKDHNFLIEDEDQKIMTESGDDLIINLSVPVFENKCFIDFTSILKDMGFAYLFEPYSHAFDGAFANLNPEDSIYLAVVKQKNTVSFSETGTMVKSTSFGGTGMASSAPIVLDTISVKLDKPFIYIIYDANDIPLYIGMMNNPSL